MLDKILYITGKQVIKYSFGFQNFSTSSLVGASMMIIRFPRSSSKGFDFLFIKSLFLLVLFFIVFASFDIWRVYC